MNVRFFIQVVISLCMAAPTLWNITLAENLPTNVAIPLAPDIQQEIARTVTALSVGNMSEKSVQKIVQEFKGFKNKAPQELLLQVLAVYGGKEEHLNNPGAEMAKRLLLSNLLREMTPLDIVAAVVPKYEQTSDPKLEYSLRQTLGMATLRDGRVDVSNPNFDAFSDFVAQSKEQPPRKLVDFMYGHNPQAAVMSMARVYAGRAAEDELASALNDDPQTALRSLAERPEWWARLYVAEMMKQQPRLRDTAILGKLKKDESRVVRERVADIELGK